MDYERIKIIAISGDMFTDGMYNPNVRLFKKGWITWVSHMYFNERTNELDGSLHPEGNRYCINFLGSAFQLHDSSPYKIKLRQNRAKRDEVIRLSEIKHKVTLISI